MADTLNARVAEIARARYHTSNPCHAGEPMNILAIITARGGSKTIPRKNIRDVAGKPLIAYTIEAALASRHVTRTLLSTDSPEIAAIGRSWGAEVPFLRPAELALDTTIGVAPVIHAVEWLAAHEACQPDYVLLLQPTSPLRTAADIDGAVDLAVAKSADAVVGLTPAEIHPHWMKHIDADGRMVNITPLEKADRNRQDLPATYYVNGAIYVIRPAVLLAEQTLFPPGTFAYVMPPERALDVNTPWELRLVDLVLRDRDPTGVRDGTAGDRPQPKGQGRQTRC